MSSSSWRKWHPAFATEASGCITGAGAPSPTERSYRAPVLPAGSRTGHRVVRWFSRSAYLPCPPFVVDDEWEDDIGLVHSQRIVQSGQSWQQGPIVLNWLDIQDSFDASGFNLIIHEVAHKLDTRNGDRASGVPFIPCARWLAGNTISMLP